MASTPTLPFTVYFDGACPLCRKEIAFYQRRRGADAIRWVDVSTSEPDAGLSQCEALARFHVRDTDGALASGGAAFAALWRQMPAFRLVGYAFKPKAMVWILEGAYRAFLPLRPHLQRFAGGKGACASETDCAQR
ncbi:MAG: DUF393 domain-containing protein [Pseudomonadota bacterium]